MSNIMRAAERCGIDRNNIFQISGHVVGGSKDGRLFKWHRTERSKRWIELVPRYRSLDRTRRRYQARRGPRLHTQENLA